MEVWQYSVMALLSAAGIFIGFLIGKATHSEVVYAKTYLHFFCGLCVVLGIAGLWHGLTANSLFVIPGFLFLFLGLLMLGSLVAVSWHK